MEELTRQVAIGNLRRMRQQHQSCEDNSQQVKLMVSADLSADRAPLTAKAAGPWRSLYSSFAIT